MYTRDGQIRANTSSNGAIRAFFFEMGKTRLREVTKIVTRKLTFTHAADDGGGGGDRTRVPFFLFFFFFFSSRNILNAVCPRHPSARRRVMRNEDTCRDEAARVPRPCDGRHTSWRPDSSTSSSTPTGTNPRERKPRRTPPAAASGSA